MSTIAERLRELRGERSLRAFGGMVERPIMSVRNYEQGNTPPPEYLAVVAKVCDVSLYWLITGEADPAVPVVKGDTAYYKDWVVHTIPLIGQIPAGPLAEAIEAPEAVMTVPFTSRRHGKLFGLRVEGNSMVPTLQPGDIVVIGEREPKSGEIAVIQTNDYDATVKRLYFDGEAFMLSADNPEHPPSRLERRQVLKLLKVEAIIREVK